jgi:TetR/AcrR family transcriptional repressor of nem operon
MVRSSRAQAAANRDRILAEAARRFRAQGFDGIGVAALMNAAGLTHGGFYSHFDSKEELMALACRRAVDDMLADWRAAAEAAPDHPLAAIVELYLSTAHRDDPGTGCLMAALGPETARQAAPVRREVTDCFERVLGTIAALTPGATPAERRAEALRLFALLVGSLIVARAVDDPALSEEVLAAARGGAAALTEP